MTQEEIRKLLGGYATDALSADERRILFEAALEDQELFNALQNEDALRELLADPVTRAQARQALASARSTRARFAWRRWALGVAVPAVVAVAAIVLMNRVRTPEPVDQVARIAPKDTRPVEPEPDGFSADEAEKRSGALQQAIGTPDSALLPPRRLEAGQDAKKETAEPLARSRLFAPAAKALLAAPSPVPDAVQQQFAVGFAGDAALYSGPLIKYSVVRGTAVGDGVRVEVTTGIAGYLALYEINAAGNTKHIYPAVGVATLVQPNQTVQIPGEPVVVDSGARLRLVVIPGGTTAVTGSVGGVGGVFNGGANSTTLGTGAAASVAPTAPLVVDIPIGR